MKKKNTTTFLFVGLLATLVFSSLINIHAQTGIHILNLIDHQAVQGIQTVRGSSAGEGFSSYFVQFSTSSNPDSWFSVIESTSPISNGVLAEWDTTIISDGDYNIRLVVLFENGDLVVDQVIGLRVRNYTAVETPTPTIESTSNPVSTPTTTLAPTILFPTATMLPDNPAIFSKADLSDALLYGGISAAIILIPIVFYQYIKQRRKY